MRTAEDEQAEAAAKAEAERLAAENKKILRPTRPEKSLVQKRAAAAAASKPKSTKASKAAAEEKALPSLPCVVPHAAPRRLKLRPLNFGNAKLNSQLRIYKTARIGRFCFSIGFKPQSACSDRCPS